MTVDPRAEPQTVLTRLQTALAIALGTEWAEGDTDLIAGVRTVVAERDRLRAVVHELKRGADGPLSDDDEDFTDDAYIQGNTTAWKYVLKVIEEGT